MVAQQSTKSAIHDPRNKRLGKLQRKRRQMTLSMIMALALLVLGVGLKAAGLLDFRSKSAEAQSVEPGIAQEAPDPFDPQHYFENNSQTAETHEVLEETPEVTQQPPAEEPENTAEIPDEEATRALPTQAHLIQYEENAPILYYAQSGDSIGVLAVRFGVETSEITSTASIPDEGFLPEGQLLLIPNRLKQTSSNLKLFPDSEVVNSPSSIGFDTQAFLDQAGGYLAGYDESVYANGRMRGAEMVDKVAREFAIHPRLLLALIEYQSGWVYGKPQTKAESLYPMGIELRDTPGLYHQLVKAAGIIESGYYGWREGTVVSVRFTDGWELRLAAELNCGSVGLMRFFSTLNQFEDWSHILYGEDGFLATYERMFGDPWLIAQEYEPLFTPHVLQPELVLPFEEGVTWTYTVGPHAAWGAADVRAALDFSPPSASPGCEQNWSWVTSAGSGLVVRSDAGTVVVDMDGDGFEQTGWNIIYLHVAAYQRVSEGTWVEAGDHIGHASCEGGIATGTHLHIVRKYNGEWVPAEGPLSFVMSGWKAKAGSNNLSGWLVRGDEVVKASTLGPATAHIRR